MAKYDWNQLEKDFILSDYKSVREFCKYKGIKYNGNTQQHTKGWNENKEEKQLQKSYKTVAKVIEKQSEKEAQQIVDLKSIANDLALNIIKSNTELHIHTDMFGNQFKGTIDANRLKKLTSALKDINDILVDKNGNTQNDLENAKSVLVKIKEVANNEQSN